eukprot:3113809-Prymnesium_polylepis.1
MYPTLRPEMNARAQELTSCSILCSGCLANCSLGRAKIVLTTRSEIEQVKGPRGPWSAHETSDLPRRRLTGRLY